MLRLGWLLTGLGVALAPVGCSSSPQLAATGAEADGTEATEPLSTVALPLDGYLSISASLLDLNRELVNRSIASCMAEQGFVYRWPTELGRIANTGTAGRYGLDDMGAAKARGYQPAPSPEIESPLGPTEFENTAFMTALNGSGDATRSVEVSGVSGTSTITISGGCTGRAQAIVYGTADDYLETMASFARLENLQFESHVNLIESDAFDIANEEWFGCMSSRSEERYRTPLDAESVVDWPSLDEEIRVAVLDVECKAEVGYVARLASFEAQWQDDRIAGFLGDIERIINTHAHLLELASG